jgi:hypothetical protein
MLKLKSFGKSMDGELDKKINGTWTIPEIIEAMEKILKR